MLVSALIWPLQLVTAQYAGLLLNAIGAASIVQGDQILRPENNFIVIETCSGLRGVVTLTMLTVLLIDLFERRGRHALLLLLLAPVVALLTNGLRVVSLVLNPHSEVASIHSLQGIVMLLIGLLVLYGIDALLERGLRASASTERSAGYGSIRPPAVLTPGRGAALAGPALVLLALVVIEAAVPPWNAHRVLERTVDDRVVEALAGWRSRPISPDYRFRGGIHFQSWSRRGVALDGGEVDLLVGLANPGNRKLSAFSRRMARPSSGYEKVAEISAPVAPGAPPARRLELTRGATRVISFAWYEPEPGFANEFVRHALALERSPFARPRAAVAIRLATRIERGESEREAEARLARVYDRIAPVVAVLGRASPSP